jgi:glutathione S-transferase
MVGGIASRTERSVILIGQYDSPFVRRVGIALHLHGMAFEHRPWSSFGDAEQLAALNPLRRVPTLVLDDGEVLVESGAILDYLDEVAGPAAALLPAAGVARRHALRTCALATGLADKAVSLLYERLLHAEESAVWTARCRAQVDGVLDALERDRAALATQWWFGTRPGHADIAVACALRFTAEAHGAAFAATHRPALAAHAAACEALPAFRAIVQPLVPPA